MKFVVVLASLSLIAVVIAAPVADHSAVEIVRSESSVEPEGFNFIYELSDGTSHQEEGHLINAGTENAAIAVKGSFSWVAEDGQTYKVDFIADENGFQPIGDHIPRTAGGPHPER